MNFYFPIRKLSGHPSLHRLVYPLFVFWMSPELILYTPKRFYSASQSQFHYRHQIIFHRGQRPTSHLRTDSECYKCPHCDWGHCAFSHATEILLVTGQRYYLRSALLTTHYQKQKFGVPIVFLLHRATLQVAESVVVFFQCFWWFQ